MIQIYEAGKSVYERLSRRLVKFKTFACVLDEPQDKTMAQATEELAAYLENTLSSTITEKNTETGEIIIAGNVYTVAHELIFAGAGMQRTPSNILRHVFSRIFTFESLYVDEDGIDIDLTQRGRNDVSNEILRPVNKDFMAFFNAQPEYLITCLEHKYKQNQSWSDEVYDAMALAKPLRPLKDFESLKELLKSRAIYDAIYEYNGLRNYLVNQCGMQMQITFDTSNFVAPVTEQPKKPNLDKKWMVDEIMYKPYPDANERARKIMRIYLDQPLPL